jgi:hypothetical protein
MDQMTGEARITEKKDRRLHPAAPKKLFGPLAEHHGR